MPKDALQPMRDGLYSGKTKLCFCVQILRRDGLVQGFTSLDEDVVADVGNGIGAVVHRAFPGVNVTALERMAGLQVANFDIGGFLAAGGVGHAEAASGAYAGAAVYAFHWDWGLGQLGGPLKQVRGRLGQFRVADDEYTAEVRGLMAYLQNEVVTVLTSQKDKDEGGDPDAGAADGPGSLLPGLDQYLLYGDANVGGAV